MRNRRSSRNLPMTREKISVQPVNAERLDDDIAMLKTYLDEDDIKLLLDSLETLKAEPEDEAALSERCWMPSMIWASNRARY